MRLVDANKMVEDLQDFYHGGYSEAQIAPYQVDRWIEQQPTVMRWIPVEESMPERGKYVLVSCVDDHAGVERYVWVAVWDYDDYADSGWSWRFPECDDPCVDIVAWMPLPEIYKEKEEK